jgi:hypothetical protein
MLTADTAQKFQLEFTNWLAFVACDDFADVNVERH